MSNFIAEVYDAPESEVPLIRLESSENSGRKPGQQVRRSLRSLGTTIRAGHKMVEKASAPVAEGEEGVEVVEGATPAEDTTYVRINISELENGEVVRGNIEELSKKAAAPSEEEEATPEVGDAGQAEEDGWVATKQPAGKKAQQIVGTW